MFWDCLSIQPMWVVSFFQMSVGSDSDLNENEKDPYQQSVQENEIDICKEFLKDVDNMINEFPDVPEFNFPADTSHFDFDPNPINQGPADVSNDNSISTPSNNLPLRESNNILENGPKKNLQGHKSKNQREMLKIPCFATV